MGAFDRVRALGFHTDLLEHIIRPLSGGELPEQCLFQLEGTVDAELVFRHFDFLGLREGLLTAIHIDELPDGLYWHSAVSPISRVSNVEIGSSSPAEGNELLVSTDPLLGLELTVVIELEGRATVDFEQVQCDDPDCQADHGQTGVVKNSGLVMTFSDGEDASTVSEALDFVAELTSRMAR